MYQDPQNPRVPPLKTQALYFPPGQLPVGNDTNLNIYPTNWTTRQIRCDANVLTCYAAGDFHTIASNPFAAATTPFIKKKCNPPEVCRPNDLFQSFVEDPQGPPSTFVPNFVPFPIGADLRGLGRILPSDASVFGVPPGHRHELRQP